MRTDEDGELVPDPLFSVMHIGTVADRDDPEGLGRVRLLIPGVYQVPSPWAFPLGTLGGGSAQRGAFFVPPKGADVGVLFALGDYERPYFISGHWGTGEVPTPLSGVSSADTPNIGVIETKNFLIILNDVSGSEELIIKDKNNATGIVRIAGGKIYGGDASASEPYVLGNQWKAGMEAMFDAIVAITVPTAVGPSGPPINAAAFTALKAQLSAQLSEIIFGK